MRRLYAIKVRLYPTDAQIVAFSKIAGCCRLVYNLGLEQRRDHWRAYKSNVGKHITHTSQKKELTALKAEFPFLSDAPSHCLQDALKNLQVAYDRFFKKVSGYPRPRKKHHHESFTFPDPAQIVIDARRQELALPKFNDSGRKGDNGVIKIRLHRPLRGKVRSVTVSRSGGVWMASILMAVRVKAPEALEVREETGVGVDRGVRIAFATSDGEALGHAIEGKRQLERQKRLSRAVARSQRGSKNRLKAVKRLAVHKAKMARRRSDMVHHATSALVKRYDWIAVEDLRVASMTASAAGTSEAPGTNVAAKSGLNRSILDKGWGMFTTQATYKMAWKGGSVLKVPPMHTSQECDACGEINKESRHGALFCCVACGHQACADTNASRVVKKRALVGRAVASAKEHRVDGTATAASGEVRDSVSKKEEHSRRTASRKVPKKANG